MDNRSPESLQHILADYQAITGTNVIQQLHELAEPLKGAKVLHVNSTREGGGVAEILHKLIPLKQALGIDADWEIITGKQLFYQCTKGFHNGLQGVHTNLSDKLLQNYEKTNKENAERLEEKLNEADFVFIHDPQPAPFLKFMPNRKGKWVWRCHIDVSRPYRQIWKYLRQWIIPYDASIFSLPEFSLRFSQQLYSTYLSYLEPERWEYGLDIKSDRRGSLAEFIKSPWFGQIFVSRTRPGVTRGNHYHRVKAEKFLVIAGEGLIRFRHIEGTRVFDHHVEGEHVDRQCQIVIR